MSGKCLAVSGKSYELGIMSYFIHHRGVEKTHNS